MYSNIGPAPKTLGQHSQPRAHTFSLEPAPPVKGWHPQNSGPLVKGQHTWSKASTPSQGPVPLFRTRTPTTSMASTLIQGPAPTTQGPAFGTFQKDTKMTSSMHLSNLEPKQMPVFTHFNSSRQQGSPVSHCDPKSHR